MDCGSRAWRLYAEVADDRTMQEAVDREVKVMRQRGEVELRIGREG